MSTQATATGICTCKKMPKKSYQSVPVTMQVGKSGLTEGVLAEIRKQLTKKKIVKIKFLRNILDTHDKQELFEKVAKETKSAILAKVGFCVVLKKNAKYQ